MAENNLWKQCRIKCKRSKLTGKDKIMENGHGEVGNKNAQNRRIFGGLLQ